MFICVVELSISLVFITQSYSAVPKTVRLNSTHYFTIKMPNKCEIQQLAFNQSLDIGYYDFMKIYRKCANEPYSLVDDTTLTSDPPLRFRKNLIKEIT